MLLSYPLSSHTPTQLKTDRFVIRPISPADAPLYFEARHDRWETQNEEVTWKNQVEALRRYEQEHTSHEAFTFIILKPDQTECWGALHIESLEQTYFEAQVDIKDITSLQDYEVALRFWLRDSCLEGDLGPQVAKALLSWLKEAWPDFRSVILRMNSADTRQQEWWAALGCVYAYDIDTQYGRFYHLPPSS